jgi:hypothetical protein
LAKAVHAPWQRVVGAQHLQLSTVDPPSAQHPGIVIGPGSRVRLCDPKAAVPEYGVLCLEVEVDGQIHRGYTIRRMVALRPEAPPKRRRLTAAVVGALAVIAVVVIAIV